MNWHLWNQLTQRCPSYRGKYRGARTIEFFVGGGLTRVKGTDQRPNCPHYKGVCIIEFNTVRSPVCCLGEGRGVKGRAVQRSAVESCSHYRGAYIAGFYYNSH